MKEQPHQDRRSFLKAMGGTTAVLAAVPAILKPTPAAAQENNALAGDGRTYVQGTFALELDGINAGWLYSAEGGNAVGMAIEKIEIAIERPGLLAKKHIG